MPASRKVAHFNKRYLNHLFLRVAGRLPGFGILGHVVRNSGRAYRVPVNVFRTYDGYIVALTHRPEADWVKNVLTAGSCELQTGRRRVLLFEPHFETDEAKSWAPLPVRLILSRIDAPTICGSRRRAARLAGRVGLRRLLRHVHGAVIFSRFVLAGVTVRYDAELVIAAVSVMPLAIAAFLLVGSSTLLYGAASAALGLGYGLALPTVQAHAVNVSESEVRPRVWPTGGLARPGVQPEFPTDRGLDHSGPELPGTVDGPGDVRADSGGGRLVALRRGEAHSGGDVGIKIETIDLNFQGAKAVTASYLLLGKSGAPAALIETGPSTCLGSLMRGLNERGVSPNDVRQVFLTHVHLDHAGAAGHLAELLPNAAFHVHEIGHRHLADPAKLVDGASRVYGEKMEELWGEVRPVPEGRLAALCGGEELEAADGVLMAHRTPGHAYHHLAYLEPGSGTLFAGDAAGIRQPGPSYVRPPTSPPDLDPESWKRSIDFIRVLEPSNIRPTHFGSFDDVERYLDELELRLEDWMRFGQRIVGEGSALEDLTGKLSAKADAELAAEGGDVGEAERYRLAGETWVLSAGLWHYLTRRREGEGGL